MQYQDIPVQNYQDYMPPPEYDRNFDQIDQYGSIIKDLTAVDELLNRYELRLLGKKENDMGEVVTDENLKPMITDEQAAKEFVEMIRSVANQNTHFTGFEQGDILNSLNALNYTMNRWLMFQGEKIPKMYRQKLSLEAMNIAKASLHKAKRHLILSWSKGNIKEGQQVNYNPNQKPGFLSLFTRRK